VLTRRYWTDDSEEIDWLSRRADHVSKAIKGLLLGLAAALGLELTQDAGAAALALLGTVLAVTLGNVYGDAVQHEITQKRRLRWAELRPVAGHSMGIVLGALPAFVLFVAAWLEIITVDLAIDATIWSGIGLLLVLGYAAGRLGGDSQRGALGHAVVLASLGMVVLLVKSIH
jgi:hypothetical protein